VRKAIPMSPEIGGHRLLKEIVLGTLIASFLFMQQQKNIKTKM
jgi:hypothetical protein